MTVKVLRLKCCCWVKTQPTPLDCHVLTSFVLAMTMT